MSKESNTPIEKLFGSKTRAKLLNLFFGTPNQSYYVREISRVIDEQINSVRRELLNLEGIGIVKKETYDKKVYYSANSKHPFCRPLMDIFSIKTEAAEHTGVRRESWDEYIRPVRRYLQALVVTNRAPGEEGVDLLIVGDDQTKKLTRWAEVVEKKKGRPLNYVILSKDDYLYRQSVRDRFILDVLEMEITATIDPDKIIQETK